MKPEVQAGVLGENELRVKVAELCGFKHHDFRYEPCSRGGVYVCKICDQSYASPPWGTEKLAGEWCDKESHGVRIPDYCNDLNAMHEAEKIMTAEQLYDFCGWLDGIMDRAPRRFEGMSWPAHRQTCTARQRAEAFVKTMEGKSIREGG